MFIITDTNPYSDGAHIAFLLDGSLAVFTFEYSLQARVVQYVVSELNRKLTQFDAALVEYSDEARLVINFTQRFDSEHSLDTIIPSILRLFKSDGWPQRIDKALAFTSKYVFASTGQDIPKIAILFAFTEFLRPGLHSNASESLRQKGVRILVVEVNFKNQREELLSITEREDDLIHITSFLDLDVYAFGDDLTTKVLKAIGKY